jgi:hypothetical protein
MGQPEELLNDESQNQTVELTPRQNEDNRPCNVTLSVPIEGETI